MKKILLVLICFLTIILIACDKGEEKPTPTPVGPNIEDYLNGFEEPTDCEHNYIFFEKEDATCNDSGWEQYMICTVCGFSTFKEIPAKGHDFDVERHIHTDETSYNLYTCKTCGYEKKGYLNGMEKAESKLQNLNVLFIGNSYTNYNTMTKCFVHICEEQGISVNMTKVAYGSQYLYDYINGQRGDYYYKVNEAVKAKKFDVVFLQEQSTYPVKNPEDFFDSTRILYTFFKNLGTKCIMYQTWGNDDDNSTVASLGCKSSFEMAQKLAAAYEAIGEELGIKVSHAGAAFSYVYEENKENKNLQLYASVSNPHPSAIGTYIVALCHYATLYGRSVKGINYTYNDFASAGDDITWHVDNVIPSISDEEQAIIEEAVDKAVFGDEFVLEEYKISSRGRTLIGK